MYRLLPLALAAAASSLLGCEALKDGIEDVAQVSDGGKDLTVYTQSATAGNNGLVRIDVDISGQRSFMVTAETSGDTDYVAVESLLDPSGREVLNWEDWYSSKESLTYAFYADVDTVLNWPIRDDDGKLEDGTYTVVVGAYRAQGQSLYYDGGGAVDVTVHRRSDDDLTSGAIKALVVYARGLDSDPTVTGGVQDAVIYWKQIWGNLGMSLEVRYASSTIDPDLPFPGYGDTQAIETVAEMTDGDEILVIIGDTIDGSQAYLGVSGNIPGTLVPTARTGTVVSWLANAGRDGRFSDEDIRLFGETLAHEVGHYTGLFHPVEDGWSYWDALQDTEKCTTRSACESALGANLMFPYPVCDRSGCVSQNKLTADQQAVMQRYTGAK